MRSGSRDQSVIVVALGNVVVVGVEDQQAVREEE